MEELQIILESMLNHIDKHKEVYNKEEWTNEKIAKVLIKINKHNLENITISKTNIKNELLLFMDWHYEKDIADKKTKEAIVSTYLGN